MKNHTDKVIYLHTFKDKKETELQVELEYAHHYGTVYCQVSVGQTYKVCEEGRGVLGDQDFHHVFELTFFLPVPLKRWAIKKYFTEG